MRRDGFIIEEIIAWDNLNDAFDTVVRGTRRKNSEEGRYLIEHRDEFLLSVREEVLSGKLDLGHCHERDIVEAGKVRHLQIFSMSARIKVAAIMIPVDKHLRRRYIRTTASSIKDRGIHDLMHYIHSDLANDPWNTRYAYKFDIRKFYDTVRHEFVRYCLHRVFKDKRLFPFFDQFLNSFENSTFESMYSEGIGLSMGLRASQGFGNLLLSIFLDHYLKDQMGVKYYYRFCDDGLVLAATKKELWKVRDAIHGRIGMIGQSIKPNERIFPTRLGIDFLGYVIFADHVLLRKRVKKNFARKINRVKSRRRRKELVGSFYGLAKHADSIHLLKRLHIFHMAYNFADLGITYNTPNGKKMFNGKQVPLSSLCNLRIELQDYDSNVKTEYGEDRYVVSFKYENGAYGKFFTNSDEMKYMLDSIREKNAFPCIVTILPVVMSDGKPKYRFG